MKSRKLIFSVSIIILLLIVFIRIQMPKWQAIAEQTAIVQVTMQAAIVQTGLAGTAVIELLFAFPTPTIAQNTTNSATQTVAALTNIPLTQLAAPSPTATLSKSNAILILDNNYLCLEGPGEEYSAVTTLVKGLRFPIYGRSNEGVWWLAQVQLSNFKNTYCWINGGIIEGDIASIKVVRP